VVVVTGRAVVDALVDERGFEVVVGEAPVPLLPHAARHSTAKRIASRVTDRS
jgi:hypothetical protein